MVIVEVDVLCLKKAVMSFVHKETWYMNRVFANSLL
jgi:hypothetical protein